MKVEKTFPLPENEPVVPDKLAEFVTTYLRGTTKIHVLVYAKGGWSKANGILMEEGDEPSEVYSMVKMCADYDSEENGGDRSKYRALMWRDLEDGRTERRTLSFEVINEDQHEEEDGSGRLEMLRKQSEVFQGMFDEMRKMTAMALEFGNRSVDRVLEQARQDSERIKPLVDLNKEMVSHFHEGLRMQATAVKEVGEMRVEQQLAQTGGKDDKFWEVMAPAVQVALMQAQQRFLGGKAPAKALPSPKAQAPTPTPTIERKEYQPPSAPPATAAGVTTPELPDTLVGLSQMVLDNLGALTLVRLSRALDDEQAGYLQSLSSAENDDTAAQAIVGLTRSLTADAAGLVKMQSLLTAPQIAVFRQLAELAGRHLDMGAEDGVANEAPGDPAKE